MIVDTIYTADCLSVMQEMPKESVDLLLTSPPYNVGKEYEEKTSLEAYLAWHEQLIDSYVRILSPQGNLLYQVGNYVEKGRVYPLDCLLFPLFIKRGLIPRNRIVWTFGHGLHCKKRLSGRHEAIMWFTKTDEYTFNLDAIRVPQKYPNKKHYKGEKKGQLSGNPLGKNPGDVWEITNVKNNHPEKTAHPCQFPLALADRVVKAYSNEGDLVFDPFAGSGTTLVAAKRLGRHYVGCEVIPEYVEIANQRLADIWL